LKIFAFNNRLRNICTGDYYFIAAARQQADVMAELFARDHNIRIDQNKNYKIIWDINTVKEYEITAGYIPLNRITADILKYPY